MSVSSRRAAYWFWMIVLPAAPWLAAALLVQLWLLFVDLF